jgi:hypothetical protein
MKNTSPTQKFDKTPLTLKDCAIELPQMKKIITSYYGIQNAALIIDNVEFSNKALRELYKWLAQDQCPIKILIMKSLSQHKALEHFIKGLSNIQRTLTLGIASDDISKIAELYSNSNLSIMNLEEIIPILEQGVDQERQLNLPLVDMQSSQGFDFNAQLDTHYQADKINFPLNEPIMQQGMLQLGNADNLPTNIAEIEEMRITINADLKDILHKSEMIEQIDQDLSAPIVAAPIQVDDVNGEPTSPISIISEHDAAKQAQVNIGEFDDFENVPNPEAVIIGQTQLEDYVWVMDGLWNM